MSWTVYKLADGALVVDGWPIDPSDPQSGFAWEEAVHGCIDTCATDRVNQVWDPVALDWVANLPLIRDRRWEEAKAYYNAACSASPVLAPFGGIQLGTTVDGVKGIDAIKILYDEARERIEAGETAWQTGFRNEANANVPVTAEDIVEIYRFVRAYLGACFVALQAARAALDAAATPEAIAAIDITAGYPA